MASSTDEEEPAPVATEPPGPVEPDEPDPDAKRFKWPSRKVAIPVIFGVVGVVLTLGSIGLYFLSSPGQLTALSYTTVQVNSSFPIAELRYEVRPSSTYPSITIITIFAQLPNNVLNPPAKAAAATAYLQLPAGVSFATCPRSCDLDPNANAYIWSQPLNFEYMDKDSGSGVAEATFPVKDSSFGYAANGTTASAAIPKAFYLGPGSAPAQLYASYDNVGAPNAYDWSGLQPQSTSASEIIWDESVPSGGTLGEIDQGVNDDAQSQDGYKIFLAGALIGLAGGALLAALQEALHAKDD